MSLEYQRYGRDKDTLVNKTYIDSGEYRRKFDKITDDPDVNKTLYNCAKAALKHRSGTEFEDMYWIDGDTGKIVIAALNETKPASVVYADSVIKAISDKKNLITLHTHPHSMPPSANDFNTNCNYKYVIGVVACHNGKVFVYRSSQAVELKLYDLYIGQYMSEKHTEYEAQIMALEKLKRSYNIDFWEVD